MLFQPERRDRAVPRGCDHQEREESLVVALDLALVRHPFEGVATLCKRRIGCLALSMGDAGNPWRID